MKSSLFFELNSAVNKPSRHFNIVMIYENRECGIAAKHVFDILLDSMPEWDFDYHLWNFDVLALNDIKDAAAEQTRHADFILIATKQDDGLPTGVDSWITEWSSQFTKRRRALVLLQDRHASKDRTKKYLQQVADRTGMDFFSMEAQPPPSPQLLTA
jgi:hypothetical protein